MTGCKRAILIVYLMLLLLPRFSLSQASRSRDTVIYQHPYSGRSAYLSTSDSLSLIRNQFLADSLKEVGDSLVIAWIKVPDAHRPSLFIDSLVRLYTVKDFNFHSWSQKFKKKVNRYNEGVIKPHGETWVIVASFSLLFTLGLIRSLFPKEFSLINQAFYNNRVLSQVNKEDNVLGSWPFIFMLLLFGLTLGMFLYLTGKYFPLNYIYDGFRWFLILTILIITLLILKIILLVILGFVFEVEKIVKEYISILYLSYFNAAIILIPFVVALCLAPQKHYPYYIYSIITLLGLVFLIQFIRVGVNILTTYRFPKVYLILYLCALEICPLLILIKALRF